MSKTGSFLVFCIERYRFQKQLSGAKVAYLFEAYDVYSYIERHYESLHTTSENYILSDIESYINDALLERGKP